MSGANDNLRGWLDELGLEQFDADERVEEARPLEESSKGFAPTEARPLEEFAQLDPVPIVNEAMRLSGIEASRFVEDPDVWEFFLDRDSSLEIKPPPPEEAMRCEEGLLRLNLRDLADDRVALVGRIGTHPTGLVLERRDEGVTFRALQARGSVPVERWCEDSEDDWLVEHVRERIEAGELERWISLGLMARLERAPRDANTREALIQKLLDGEPTLDAQRQWATQLDEEALRELERRALALAEMFDEHLDRLIVREEPVTATQLRHVCEERDELECLRVPLLVHDRSEAFDDTLRARDARARGWLESVDDQLYFEGGEWLIRVKCQQPESWWVERVLRG